MAVRLGPWVPLSPTAWLRPPLARLPYPLEEPDHRVFAFGRQALWHGVAAIGLSPGDRVLAPAWHHGSEIDVFVRRGLVVDLYDGVYPDRSELEKLLTNGTKALHLIHPLGFPQDIPRWRAWCDERGLLLIEDAAQAWLADVAGHPVGASADLAIYCLYKSLGVPEGAVGIARSPLPEPAPNPRVGVADHGRRHASWVAQRSSVVAWLAGRRRPVPYDPGADVAMHDPHGGPWTTTDHLVRRLAEPGVAGRRRANYRVLLEHLVDRVPGPFDHLPAGASPFVFPIEARGPDKAAELDELAAAGIKALDLWSHAHPIVGTGHPVAERLRRTVIGLPVHQELRRRDLDRIATVAGGRPGAAPLPAVTVLDPDDPSVIDAWSALALRSTNVFSTPEVLRVWRHQARGRTELVGVRSADGVLRVLLPLVHQRVGSVEVTRFWGHGVGDQLGPIHASGDELLAAEALRRHLAASNAVLVGEQLPAAAGWGALLDARSVRHERSPSVRAEGRSWEEWLASRSSNFRQEVRRRERNVRKRGDLAYRLSAAETLDDDLDLLFRLHADRWGSGSDWPGEQEELHRRIAHGTAARGWLRLWILELDGQPRAAWYGFRYADHESYYQAGRDPAFDELRLGFVLLAHTVRAALDDGVASYRFLRGDERYKDRFADDEGALETIIGGAGAGARSRVGALGAAAAAQLVASLPDGARRRASRLAGR